MGCAFGAGTAAGIARGHPSAVRMYSSEHRRASERRKRQCVRILVSRGWERGRDYQSTSRLIECLLISATEGHLKGVPRHARHLPAVAPLGGGEDLWQLIAHEVLEGHLGVPLAPDGIEHNRAIARHCALNIGQPEAGEGRELLEWIGLGLGLGLRVLSPLYARTIHR